MNKILIVEDESLVAHHLKLILTAAGYKISGISESVDEALTNIADHNLTWFYWIFILKVILMVLISLKN
jgi:DNA-binding response OmpR family regulator